MRLSSAVLCLLLSAAGVHAQDAADPSAPDTGAGVAAVPAPWQPRTGSDWIDAHLHDMDAYAARYRDAFVDEIVRYHEAPRALVVEALADPVLHAGDVYYACSLAGAIGRSCRTVLEARRLDPSEGWEAVAARLEVATGIDRRIRGDIAESYVRWGRPLVDAAGRRDAR
ncbi:hypothetical protein QFW80_14560 [Luteimonas sp. M1R5S18]|uniref:Secreted protein n=1 Tax=Luteimonas rhizosphaericola TaxID=3042024 RepID=A0ABT6JP68_9GAMM|nr:hypothetical protein [Luteimonas rhizosphaericola]MDH5831741.1 hypothetical protein [Luteimonas rhizosphaericola]